MSVTRIPTTVAITPTPSVSGTFTQANNTTETLVLEILNPTNIVRDFVIRFDLSEITKNNYKLYLYFKINDSSYVLQTESTFGAIDDVGQFAELACASSLKITAQSTRLEGATRVLTYRYALVNR